MSSSRHAVVVSYLALFVALGGTAAALQGERSVKSDDLATGAVGSRALAKGAVDSGDIRGQAVESRNIERQAIGKNKLKLQSVTSQAIDNRTIRAEDLTELLEVPLATNQAIIGEGDSLRVKAPFVYFSRTREGTPAMAFETNLGGGGGLVLDGGAGTPSGYLRIKESPVLPPEYSGAVSLFVRRVGSTLHLTALFPGGGLKDLASYPP
ncbi:MAG TPA: hypothetical protein VKA89_04170 [Solirubrobacterales bacterium]|nr:hypothetical protein [Solirubrobacterales bacterium]